MQILDVIATDVCLLGQRKMRQWMPYGTVEFKARYSNGLTEIMSEMNLKELILLPRGIPFSEVVKEACPNAFLSESAYRVGDGVYLQISSFPPGCLEDDPSGPFVYGIALAASDGAIRRAFLMELESDDGKTLDVPAEFLPSEGAVAATYGEILRGLKSDKPKVCFETASYRIATDGRFIHRKIETERFTFFFRKQEHDDSEAPYAIIRKLLSCATVQ
jgi:hypothetical protein